MPVPAQLRHFGSSSFKCKFVPDPMQAAHFPSPWQSMQASRAIHDSSGKAALFHRATSATSSSLDDRTERSLSATNPTAVSIALRVVSSVQHHSAAFPNSG
jgi:hypothetical protein